MVMPHFGNYVEKGYSPVSDVVVATGKQLTVSESHPKRAYQGVKDGGGPFYTSLVKPFIEPGFVKDARWIATNSWWTGPVYGAFPTTAEFESVGFDNTSLLFGDFDEAAMKIDGTNAIAYCNPINPVSELGLSYGEIFNEGKISLPGISSWKNRTSVLKAAGSEYLSAVFGWLPLIEEIGSVRDAVTFHNLILNQYHRGEGRNTRRKFEYPLQRDVASAVVSGAHPLSSGMPTGAIDFETTPTRTVSKVIEKKRWFEGCFTYGLPSSTDSWQRALGFGSDADKLFGTTLTPDLIWELSPWTWAVDWFSNANEVITNFTNFEIAGLVMRYGYMMEETIERISVETGPAQWFSKTPGKRAFSSPCVSGYELVTKRRIPASPYGFSIGWEDLSPTQLAITAALGITKLL